ncbi:MAG: ABC transporter ATP-binding protein [Bacillota bacterium]
MEGVVDLINNADSRQPIATGSECVGDLLLEVEDLHTQFSMDEGVVQAVDGVSFRLRKTEVLGLVGESGCGKSVTALSVMQLVPGPKGKIRSGRILYYRDGCPGAIDIARQNPAGAVMRSIRGNEIAMVFQEPMTSLNPVHTVGFQIVEAVMLHQKVSKKQAWDIAADLLDKVGIPCPCQRVREYPHQMSGGMRQRAMIAMALSCTPRLLIADEPTTALDVTIQAQILDLIRKLQEQYQMAIIMITHNLGVVSKMCDNVAVMYMGKIVECSDTRTVFRNPAHPYTVGLLNSIPRMGARKNRLVPIEGVVPDPFHLPEGCSFGPRCPRYTTRCAEDPPTVWMSEGHQVRCWLYA